jgi:hypothetical protein
MGLRPNNNNKIEMTNIYEKRIAVKTVRKQKIS